MPRKTPLTFRLFCLLLLLLLGVMSASCRPTRESAPLKVEVDLVLPTPEVNPAQPIPTAPPPRPLLPGQEVAVGAAEVILAFRFGEAMDRASAAAAITVNPAVGMNLQWASDNLVQVFLSNLPTGTPVSVTLGTQARSTKGACPPASLSYVVKRVEPPLVSATLVGQTDISAPGNYRVLPGKKTLRLDFSHPMDTAAVEAALLRAIPPLSQPTLRWENDQVAYLDFDLPVDAAVTVSLAGLPDRAGIPSQGPGQLLIMGAGTVRLLAGNRLDQPGQISTLLDQFDGGTVSPNGQSVAFTERFQVGESAQVNVWVMDLQRRALGRRGSYVDTGTFALAWAPDSAHLVVAAGHDIVVLPAGSGEARSLSHAEDRVFVGMSVAPRSGRVACFLPAEAKEGASVDLVICNPKTGETKTYPAVTRLLARESHWVPIPSAWSPDDKYIAFPEHLRDGKQTLTLIDPETGATKPLQGPATAVAWSPDGRYLAVRGPEGSWDLLETATGERKPVLPGETFSLAFWSPDGSYLLLGHVDKGTTLALWDVREGSPAGAPSTGIPLGWSRGRALWIAEDEPRR